VRFDVTAVATGDLVIAPLITLSRQPARQELASTFGATGIIEARGDEANARVLELTAGIGIDAAMECVGTAQSMSTAMTIARSGSTVGVVGVPHGVELPFKRHVLPQRRLARRPRPRPPLHPRAARRRPRQARSTPGSPSTSRPTWTASARATRQWMTSGHQVARPSRSPVTAAR